MTWVPLHVHSQYTILEATASVSQLARYAGKFQLSSLALTDSGNLFGAVEFFKACKKEGVKPVIGCEVNIAPESRHLKKRTPGIPASHQLVLLAKNDEGYRNLCVLSSIGYLEGFYYKPRIDKEVLKQYSKGLICLSGGTSGQIAWNFANKERQNFLAEVQWYHDVFGEDYYFEIQRHAMSSSDIIEDGMRHESWLQQKYENYISRQDELNLALLDLSKEKGIPFVASNDIHYLEKEDWKSHEVLLNVQSGEPCEIWEKDSLGNNKCRVPNPKRQTFPSHELYFKSPEQMQALFQDIPEALERTLDIAEACNVELDFETKHYPVYLPPSLQGANYNEEQQKQAVEGYLWELCRKGVQTRYTPERLLKVKEKYPSDDPMDVVRKRLDYEMGIITSKGMSDYLLIVWDFIHWAKSNNIPVGPGRGSGAGSIICYLIGITDIEPLRFNLFFERFINPERLSYPDIDVDICMDNRGKVIDYTLNKYGSDNVAQIVTFGTMKAKMAIKDVGRVLSVPLSKVNMISKLIPEDPNMTLDKALEMDVDFQNMFESDDEAASIVHYAKKLEGSVRNTGIHAAGIIISGEPLIQHVPVFKPKDAEMAATQFSMKPVESVGMLKVDFLGLKTLTSIQTCVNAIRESLGLEINWMDLALDNAKTFELLNQGKTLGVFQLESPGMQELARQLHLDCFEEIIAVVSLYRPGPMDMIPSFIERKHGREKIEVLHPWTKEILEETYGIMVYQEQVMQIASKLANFSLGEGDVLRRAMGKKDMKQMVEQREKFRLGATSNGINEDVSMQIFDQMEKFAAYGFNKSHAAAYAYLSYVTAYMKANYPREWMAALMTCDRDDLTKVAKFMRECKVMDISILSPDVNESGHTFVATASGIRFAMSGIKGVGTGVVDAIIEERNKNGLFQDLYDFIRRVDLKRVGKKVIECIIDAGGFDFVGWSRDAMRQSVDEMYDVATKEQKDAVSGVITFFSLMGDDAASRFSKAPNVVSPSSKVELLMKEKTLLGLFLTGHPLDLYQSLLQRLSCVSLQKMLAVTERSVFRAVFIVESVNVRVSARNQRKFAIVVISDGVDCLEMPVWPELYEQYQHLLVENQLLYGVLTVDCPDDQLKVSCNWLADLTKANEEILEDCDRAVDRARALAARMAYSKSRGQKKSNAQTEPVQAKTLHISLNINEVRLSQILQLKTLFRDNRGNTPIKLFFISGKQSLASVEVDGRWGVTFSSDLESQLKQCHSLVELKMQ